MHVSENTALLLFRCFTVVNPFSLHKYLGFRQLKLGD
jgi:hypothetical protein